MVARAHLECHRTLNVRAALKWRHATGLQRAAAPAAARCLLLQRVPAVDLKAPVWPAAASSKRDGGTRRSFLTLAAASAPQCPFSGMGLPARTPDHLPFLGHQESQPWRMEMGITPASLDDWIEVDGEYAAEMRQRANLLDHKRDVVLQSLDSPAANEAHAELLEWLLDHLPRAYPGRFIVQGSVIHNLVTGDVFDTAHYVGIAALELAGRLVQEDFVIMHQASAGAPVRLVSGVVCFPLHWTVLDKLGQSIPKIHEDVPFFNSQIGRFVEALFVKTPVGRVFSRQNWTITRTSELHMVPGVREAAEKLPSAAAADPMELAGTAAANAMNLPSAAAAEKVLALAATDAETLPMAAAAAVEKSQPAGQTQALPAVALAVGSATAAIAASRHATAVAKAEPTDLDAPLNVANAGRRLFLRVERQNVHRLPRSGTVLFTIRTFLRPLHDVVSGRPQVAASLAAAYRSLPDEVLQYKSLAGHKAVALGYLDAMASGRPAV